MISVVRKLRVRIGDARTLMVRAGRKRWCKCSPKFIPKPETGKSPKRMLKNKENMIPSQNDGRPNPAMQAIRTS